MKFLFRVDASHSIGTGHVARCLTLANHLRASGASCSFVCLELQGNLIPVLKSLGYSVHALPPYPTSSGSDAFQIDVAADSSRVTAVLEGYRPDWLIVDHYGIEARWESTVRELGSKLLVIDDLANRPHVADMLVDQNFGRTASDYLTLVPQGSRVLAGPEYAILRPEFARERPASLARRSTPSMERLLITMGGSDPTGVTMDVMKVLQGVRDLPIHQVTVVMGSGATATAAVSALATAMPFPTTVLSGVGNMAEVMRESDVAIGAGGSTALERCCLGLPTIQIAIADNQEPASRLLHDAGAVRYVGRSDSDNWKSDLVDALRCFADDPHQLEGMSRRASMITDGSGTSKVCDALRRPTHR